MTSTLRRPARFALGAALATGTVLALAAPASAHVTIDPKEVPGGGYATVNIKVPNERDNASTVAVELHLDLDHPVASAMPQPVPGWEIEIETTVLDEPLEVHGNEITEVPSKITWTGGEIEPGMFQQFPVSVGRLPEDADQLLFKAIQTYDNGEEVRWIEEPGEDAENPAAVLALTAADGDGHGATDDADDADHADGTDDAQAGVDVSEDGGNGDPAVDTAADTSDTTARVLAGVGIGAGALGVAFGLLAGRRRTTES
jgi:uncharacterized protein YcnI